MKPGIKTKTSPLFQKEKGKEKKSGWNKRMRKNFVYLFSWVIIWLFSLFSLGITIAANPDYAGTDYCNAGDLMQQAFCTSMNNGTQIDMGNNKKTVGNVVMGNTQEVTITTDGFSVEKKSSLLVHITRSLLMVTIVISVTMIIICGIRRIIKSWSGADPTEVKGDIIKVIIGILLALFSGVLVTLFRSVGTTTIDPDHHDEASVGLNG